MRNKKKEQPCWTCVKFAKGCSWSEEFKPIEGWIATQRNYPLYTWSKIENGRKIRIKSKETVVTYAIDYCPEYIEEPKRKENSLELQNQ